jgi:catechol 2,3-dioxygenase-like lactoylglutathione lyase family enzyme
VRHARVALQLPVESIEEQVGGGDEGTPGVLLLGVEPARFGHAPRLPYLLRSQLSGTVVAMPVHRLNHAVLYVGDVQRSVAFYRDALGFRTVMSAPGAAFLQAPDSSNDHDLGLFEIGAAAGRSTAGRATVGLYHLAWEVDTLTELQRIAGVLTDAGALVGSSDHGTTKSLYAKDPDGLEFEVVWLVPAALVDDADKGAPIRPLDLTGEIARYGGQTRGGVGVSVPA